MKQRQLFVVFLVMLLGTLNSSGSVSVDQIWEEGAKLTYHVTFSSLNRGNALYDSENEIIELEYLGTENESHVFVKTTDDEYTAEFFFGGYGGAVYYVDPQTGKDQNGKDTLFFHNTSKWTNGFQTNISYYYEFPNESNVTKNHYVVGTSDFPVGDQLLEVWEIRIDDFEQLIGGVMFFFTNLRALLTKETGIMLSQSFRLATSNDQNGDGNYESSEEVYSMSTYFEAIEIGEGVNHGSLIPKNQTSTDSQPSTTESTAGNVSLNYFYSLIGIVIALIVKKRTK